MKFRVLLRSFLILLFASLSISFAQQINDLIPPIHLTVGKVDSIPVSDLFYRQYYNVKFTSDKKINVIYRPIDNMLFFHPLNNFEGMDLLRFQLGNRYFHIPVISTLKEKHTFKYKPEGNPKNVNLFGSFNGWNRENIPMHKNKEGIYETNVPLDPGRYEYKFYVDGKEIIDPVNPAKTPNGFGDFNSVIKVENRHSGKAYLHILDEKLTGDVFTISFYYEKENQTSPIDHKNVLALLNNNEIIRDDIAIKGDTISISFKGDVLRRDILGKTAVIRAAITQDGQNTNIQTVRLIKGKPAGKEEDIFPENSIIYSIMIDRFDDGDKSNSEPVKDPHLTEKANYFGGDLQGIIDKLDDGYFDSLGVNTLWISPVNDNTDSAFQEYPEPHRYYTGYHGYWPISPTRVEERFGDMNLLKKMISIAHQHNIKVLLDYVANHVHEEHPYFKEHRDWFGQLKLPNGKLNLRLWDEHRLTTWFEPYMPSFDYEGSQAAVDTMTDNAVWWLKETGADGFRHDAVKHVPNKFWRTLTKKLKQNIEVPENKTLFQIGETFGSYHLVSSYVDNGQLDAQFNFNLYDTAIPTFVDTNVPFKQLDNQLKQSFDVYGVNNLMGNVMDSHDKVRFMAYADSDVSLNGGDASEIGWNNPPEVDHKSSYKKLELFLAFNVTIPGVPVVYYGDEIGMTGAADPDNRRMMRFGNQLSGWEKETLNDVRKIIHLRKNNSALKYGDFQTLDADSNLYVYLRDDLNERVLIALNKDSVSHSVSENLPKIYNLTEAEDLMNGDKINISQSKISFDIPALGFRILKLK